MAKRCSLVIVSMIVGPVYAAVGVPDRSAVQDSPPAVELVTARAAAYAARYLDQLSSLVLQEDYSQEVAGISRVVTVTPQSRPQVVTAPGRRRDLRSDTVLVRVGPPLEWQMFRDVFEVDGRPVRDRQDRLARLFQQPADVARAQALRIDHESARFNISDVGRTLNVPGIPILFVQAPLRPRFTFEVSRRDEIGGRNVWVLRYRETERPTLFQHNSTQDNPSGGRIWIDVDTGVVLRTEHVLTPPRLRVSITTQFRFDDRSGIALPVEMHEQISGSTASIRSLDGVARYSNVRRFEVRTDEALAGQGK
ncbi:MAG: hypothetical protein IT184_05015 [Acidobacteria bacterium]|nr:hypothetical protein [Acidobacteriota bacterium]